MADEVLDDYELGYADAWEEAREAMQESVTTIIAQIRRGDTLDAITTLEREFWPKWASVQDSEAALRKAQAAAVPANDNQEAAAAASEGEVV